MRPIFYSTLYSFKEIKNSKIFYSFLIFAIILISGSYFVSQTSFINQGRIMVDFSIFAITIFNIFIGIFVGSSVVYDDIEKKSIFLAVTRPVKRTEYLIGRFLGLAVAIIFSTVIMMFIFYLVLLLMHKFIVPVNVFAAHASAGTPEPMPWTAYMMPRTLIVQALFIIIESVFVSVISILFSLITSKALASIFAILIFFIGNVSGKMNDLVRPVKALAKGKIVIIRQPSHVLAAAVHFVYTVLPNFSIFNVSAEAAYKTDVPGGTILYGIIYGICYSVLLFMVASLIFAGKDIS